MCVRESVRDRGVGVRVRGRGVCVRGSVRERESERCVCVRER